LEIVFRVDASLGIGTGHVMRCLALADVLRVRGADCTFICRPHTGHLMELISQRGHKILPLPALVGGVANATVPPAYANWLGTDWLSDVRDTCKTLGSKIVDWLVVDHYALERRWEQALRTNCRKLMVIDDLADRMHDCDLLLDQNLGRKAEDYCDLLPLRATILIGPQYALLRPEFAQLRTESLARRANPQIKHLLITMGGVDKDNATGRVLQALKSSHLPVGLQINVVLGPKAPWLQQVQAQAIQMNRLSHVLVGVNNMARLMADSDLAIGAAGSTAWERCCLGLPSLILVLSDNQQAGATALQNAGAAILLQSTMEIPMLIQNLTSGRGFNELRQMGLAGATVTEGNGVSHIIERLVN
jgi:UDP-2,4-diacetamido-2,4,6-trideoxy-beta-L-altropyranose hydrolase